MMNMTTQSDTREHILNIGEQLCLEHGFHGTGLIALLKAADVPKGSFYYYFSSKESFGVAMLQRYFARRACHLDQFLKQHQGNSRQRILDYYAQSYEEWHKHPSCGCLSVKLSAEVCDLSETMRNALAEGSATLIDILKRAISRAQQQGALPDSLSAASTAETFYMLWMGAILHSKIRRDREPLRIAISQMRHIFDDA